jgi:hypothetical protein
MPGDAGVTVVSNSCAFSFRTRGCGRNARPAFPAPSDFQRVSMFQKNSRGMRGEIAGLWPRLFEN